MAFCLIDLGDDGVKTDGDVQIITNSSATSQIHIHKPAA